MLNEINDLAGQHEVIAENLSTAVVSDLSILVKSMRDDRRKVRKLNFKQVEGQLYIRKALDYPRPALKIIPNTLYGINHTALQTFPDIMSRKSF